MAHNLLSEIHDKSKQWTICVVVSRMWHYRGGTDEGPIIHTDLVLIDRQGTHMYGQIPPQPAERLKDVLKEGKVFVIKKILCNPSKSAFRPVESPYMVQFTRYSMVEEKPGMEEAFPFCTYSLTPFADIPKPTSPPARFIDIIGRITMVSDVVPIQSMHQTVASDTRTVVLTDLLGQEMRIVLWGARAAEFDAETVRAMGAKEPVIAIFVGTLPKIAHGARSLSGSSACRWYIDEDIPDINSFRASLGDKFTALDAYVPSSDQQAFQARVQPDPIETTVLELNKLDPFEDLDKRFICTVAVNRVSTDQRWWFASCTACRKSARVTGYEFKCTGPACGSVDADLTYCVSVYASDVTDEAEFVLFDKVATAAVGKPLITLMHQRYPGHRTIQDIAYVARSDMTTPPEIARLVGQKYKLLVAISKKSFSATSTEISFVVNRIVETFKPELPPTVLAVVPGFSGASSSAKGLDMPLSPLGTGMVLMPTTPSALGSQFQQPLPLGQQSPVLQPHTPASYDNRIAALSPGSSSSAPMRGTRRSLFSPAPKDTPELPLQRDLLAGKATAEVESITGEKVQELDTEAGVDEDAAVPTEGKVSEVVAEGKASKTIIQQTKRNASGAKANKDGKKQKS